jgi:hypothetical protein
VTTESLRWLKSTHSDNGGQCVEVALNVAESADVVPVRDSKDPVGPALTFTADAWTAFVSGVQKGDFPGI